MTIGRGGETEKGREVRANVVWFEKVTWTSSAACIATVAETQPEIPNTRCCHLARYSKPLVSSTESERRSKGDRVRSRFWSLANSLHWYCQLFLFQLTTAIFLRHHFARLTYSIILQTIYQSCLKPLAPPMSRLGPAPPNRGVAARVCLLSLTSKTLRWLLPYPRPCDR